MAWKRSFVFSSLLFSVALGCESPFEPRGLGERVPIGLVIEQEVGGDSVDWYSFQASPQGLYVVFLEALQGRAFLEVIDSSHQYLSTSIGAGQGGPKLQENPSSTVGTPEGGVYRLRVTPRPLNTSARYRFMVYAIDQAPELLSDRFALGDTVTGETIDPMVDVDSFTVHGDAGQEIVAVAEAQGPSGSGSVGLSVIDPVANDFLGYVFADAGASIPLTTGRLRFSASHDYRFFFGSVTSNQYPRYRGPYRFWTYVINRAPEHRAAAIPFNVEIGNEALDRAGDVDEFTFQASAETDFNAFLQGPEHTFQLEVARLGGTPFASSTSQPSDTALFVHATNRFHITSAGTYVLRVTGANAALVADTGAYRFYLYAIDPRPEQVSAIIPPGDTIAGEDIALPGDIDEFTFSGAAGEEFNVFLQAQNGLTDPRLGLEVLDGSGTVLRTVESVGTDTSLLRQASGRLTLPATGTYRLRVAGIPSYGSAGYRGSYRLFVYRVNRRPESVPDTLAFGDSVIGEATDVPGDIDEFRVRVPDSSGANLALELESQPVGGSLTVELIDSVSGQVIVSGTAYSTGRGALGRLRPGPGTYIVRADGNPYGDPSYMRGGYRLWFYRFGYGPEVAADTFAIGDTVSGESIEPWGDEDQFHFHALQNQHVNILVQGLAAQSDGGLQLLVTPPPGTPAYGVAIGTGTSAGALEDHQSARVDLPATGWYTVDVSGISEAFANRGPYRFTILPIDPAPEHVSAALVPGDSVMSEPIDAPGDLDEFTVTATAGQELSVIFDGRDGFTGPFLYTWVYDPATFDTLAFQVGQFRRIAGPFQVPGSGQFKIEVLEPRGLWGSCYDSICSGVYQFVGSYGFHVVAVNRAPENAPATYVIGDTVRGETISPVGDIDEFTSTGTPGEQLTLFDRLTVNSSLDSAIVVEVIDPATGTSLAGSNVAIFGSSGFFPVGSFTVPPSGSFIVRAHVYGESGYGVGTTSYDFFVSRP